MTIIEELFPLQITNLELLGMDNMSARGLLADIYMAGYQSALESSLNRDNHTGWYTDLQIRDLLVAVQVFANANNGIRKTFRDNGTDMVQANLMTVAGESYGQRAEVMLKAFLTSKSTQETVSKFKTPLEEYELS